MTAGVALRHTARDGERGLTADALAEAASQQREDEDDQPNAEHADDREYAPDVERRQRDAGEKARDELQDEVGDAQRRFTRGVLADDLAQAIARDTRVDLTQRARGERLRVEHLDEPRRILVRVDRIEERVVAHRVRRSVGEGERVGASEEVTRRGERARPVGAGGAPRLIEQHTCRREALLIRGRRERVGVRDRPRADPQRERERGDARDRRYSVRGSASAASCRSSASLRTRMS